MEIKFSKTTQIALLWGSAAIIVTFAIIRWRQRKIKSTKWQKVGEISELHIYPLKSGRAVQLKEAECMDFGLKSTNASPKELQDLQDRCMLVYNADDGNFMTCRNYPSLMSVKITNGGDGILVFDAPNMPQLRLKPPDDTSVSKVKKVRMWFGEEVEALDCGNEAAKWICSYLNKHGMSLRLGWYIPKHRDINVPPWDKYKQHYNKMENEHTGAFSDLASFMLLSESSLNDLKCKLPSHLQSIPATQFRPNIVVRGAKPYEEDGWDLIRIGDDVVLQGFKPCTRCTTITMDPETGVRDPSLEPLRTMKKYRQLQDPEAKELEGDAPVMGLYAGLCNGGIVKIGDPVYINNQ